MTVYPIPPTLKVGGVLVRNRERPSPCTARGFSVRPLPLK